MAGAAEHSKFRIDMRHELARRMQDAVGYELADADAGRGGAESRVREGLTPLFPPVPLSPLSLHSRSGTKSWRRRCRTRASRVEGTTEYDALLSIHSPLLAPLLAPQERHYELAVQMQDEVEQQRSSTQLGRAYFDSFTSGGDAAAAAGADIEAALEQQAASMQTLKSARKYFQLSLRLAKGLHEGWEGIGGAGARAGGNGRARGVRAGRSGGGSGGRSSGGNRRFAQELADAYNNVGLLFEEVESYDEAVNCFDRGLEVGVGRRPSDFASPSIAGGMGIGEEAHEFKVYQNSIPLPAILNGHPLPNIPSPPPRTAGSPYAHPSRCATTRRLGQSMRRDAGTAAQLPGASVLFTKSCQSLSGRLKAPTPTTSLPRASLQVCDDEEIGSIDETRTRLHNSLGRVFTKSCQWEQARKHIDMDVRICERLNNAVGCAKAWINKGDFCFKKEEYDEAERAFRRARDILQQVEDEEALLATCESNLENVAEAKRQKEYCEQLWGQHRKTQRLLERAG
ncbi:unnamed protein product [Closterium sp. Naga37s-1]|nr:unnamed protein product [Closterium sp. Naga37s-1]